MILLEDETYKLRTTREYTHYISPVLPDEITGTVTMVASGRGVSVGEIFPFKGVPNAADYKQMEDKVVGDLERAVGIR